MRFQVNIEIDEEQAKLSQKEVINYVMDSLAESLDRTGAYYEIGCRPDYINELMS